VHTPSNASAAMPTDSLWVGAAAAAAPSGSIVKMTEPSDTLSPSLTFISLTTPVSRKQFVPAAAANHLDDVPACAAKIRLQFLDDLAIAAYRSIKALQVAIDDKNQVIESLASRQRNRSERLRLDRSVRQNGLFMSRLREQ
jgi:hypothetical protein